MLFGARQHSGSSTPALSAFYRRDRRFPQCCLAIIDFRGLKSVFKVYSTTRTSLTKYSVSPKQAVGTPTCCW